MTPLFNRRQRHGLFKLWYLLSLVRWYSILVIIVALFLSALFLFNHDQQPILATLFDPYLFLCVFSTCCIIASGFIINNFYDLERDTINRPDKVIFNRLVDQSTCLNMYFFFNTIGVGMSFFVDKYVMLFNFIFSISLWFYSHKLKKKAFLGELSAALLNIAPFFVLVIYYHSFPFDIFLYLSFIGLMIIIREIIKDVLSIKGDIVFGYTTLPIKIGMAMTKKIITFFMTLTLIPFVVLFYIHGWQLIMGYFFVGEICIFLSAFMLFNANDLADYERLNTMYKFITLIGIFSIPLV